MSDLGFGPPITTAQARQIANDWVDQNTPQIEGFQGASLHGSLTGQSPDAVLSPWSDVDLIIVTDRSVDSTLLGKHRVQDVLLDVSTIPPDQLASPEQVLGTYHLAGSFRFPGLLADPTGHLTTLQQAVARDFTQERWVRCRVADAATRVERHIDTSANAQSLPQAVTGWLFGAGVLTHMLLVAGLRNPTVRRRYEESGRLLADYGLESVQEELLALLGVRMMDRTTVQHHLDTMTPAFDAAAAALKTPVFFASDLTQAARPIAIDATQAMIDANHHREAMFWIAATWSRIMQVLEVDAPADVRSEFDPDFENLLTALGIGSAENLASRRRDVLDALPAISAAANQIITANPEIRR